MSQKSREMFRFPASQNGLRVKVFNAVAPVGTQLDYVDPGGGHVPTVIAGGARIEGGVVVVPIGPDRLLVDVSRIWIPREVILRNVDAAYKAAGRRPPGEPV
jgi:hypothetical protein